MINGKITTLLVGGGVFIATLALVGGGAYYFGHKGGYDEAITEISKESAKLIERALLEQEAINAEHLQQLARYSETTRKEQSKVSGLQAKLRKIQAKEPVLPDRALCDGSSSHSDDVKWLFNRAVDSESLRRETDQPNHFTEETPTATYLLFAIEQYNSCAVQLNTLIDAVE